MVSEGSDQLDKIEGESEHGLCLHRTCQRKFEQKHGQLSAF
jgi:hypothetical protein